jgi:GTP cyclohydrolase II
MRVTLSFAQSLDGSIAAQPGERTTLSGPAAMAYTHRLRAAHDAILVGIGTVLTDNPRLTVRLADGPNPQPLVLDSLLRLPLTCALVAQPVRPLCVICSTQAPIEAQRALEGRGVRVLRLALPDDHAARWPVILAALDLISVRTLMVEGGARVMSSLLAAGCADKLALTIVPRWLNGVQGVRGAALPLLVNIQQHRFGDDLVIEADLVPS